MAFTSVEVKKSNDEITRLKGVIGKKNDQIEKLEESTIRLKDDRKKSVERADQNVLVSLGASAISTVAWDYANTRWGGNDGAFNLGPVPADLIGGVLLTVAGLASKKGRMRDGLLGLGAGGIASAAGRTVVQTAMRQRLESEGHTMPQLGTSAVPPALGSPQAAAPGWSQSGRTLTVTPDH